MAARENQGLQIALIIFVMITVVLAVTTYVYCKKADDLAKAKQQAEADKVAIETEVAGLKKDQGDLKALLGYPADAKRAEIEANQRADMALFTASYQGERNYRTLAPFLVDEVVKRTGQLTDAREKQTGLETQISVVRTEESRLAGQARDAARTTQEEMVRLRQLFNTDRVKITDDQKALAAQAEKQAQAQQLAQEAAKKQIAELGSRLHKAEQLVAALRVENAELRGPTSTEGADGQITYVDQGSKIVYLNLGDADGLRRQMTFTVVDRDAGNPNKAKGKATVEVSKILEPHLAEARIVADDLRNPILTGDQVYAPMWAPGQKLRFALIGFMDLDGDGHSDRARIKALVTQSGGEVVAEVTDDGKRIGQIDLDTRYLVVGEKPTDKTRPELIEGFTALTNEAGRLGIEQLSVSRFLGFVGHRESRTVQLGSGQPGQPSVAPRTPPAGKKGAF